jgi:DNA-binding IclR family transcriptional regulator
VLDGFDEVILRRIDHARQIVQVAPQVERRHPAHSTSGGLAALALMGQCEVQQIVPGQLFQRTPNTIQTQEALFARLGQIRADGYSLDMEEAYLGVRCIAVAIEAPGWPIVTISFTLPLQRAPVEHLVSLTGPLQTAARQIRDILIVTPRG